MVLFTFKKSNELVGFAMDKKITGRDFKVQAGIGVKTWNWKCSVSSKWMTVTWLPLCERLLM